MINKTNNTQFFVIKSTLDDYIPQKQILNKTKDEIMEASQIMPLVLIEEHTNIISFAYITRVILYEAGGAEELELYFNGDNVHPFSFSLSEDYPFMIIPDSPDNSV